MLLSEGILLGHHISPNGIEVDPSKVTIIQRLPTPHKQSDIRIFLGHVGFYKRFIKDFSNLVAPLFTLLSKNAKFCWSIDFQRAVYNIKEKLIKTSIFRRPGWDIPFQIHIDSSDSASREFIG